MSARAPTPGWRHARWLAVLELAIVVALVVADARRLVFFSKTPSCWGHVDQGLTGQVQAGVDGFLLGALYLGLGRNLLTPVVAHGVSSSLALVLIHLGYYPGI